MGRMALTGTITKFNVNAVEEQWGREVLFVALHLVGVYPFCGFLDLFVINSLEFWNGTNPISGEEALTLSAATGTDQDAEKAAVAATAEPKPSGGKAATP